MPNQRKAGKRLYGVWIDEERQRKIEKALNLERMNKTEFALYAFEVALEKLVEKEKQKKMPTIEQKIQSTISDIFQVASGSVTVDVNDADVSIHVKNFPGIGRPKVPASRVKRKAEPTKHTG